MKNILFTFFAVCLALFAISACKGSGKNEKANRDATFEAVSGDIEVGLMDVTYFIFKDFGTRMVIPEMWMNGVQIKKKEYPEGGCLAEYDAVFVGENEKENQFLGGIYIFTNVQWDVVPDHIKSMYMELVDIDGNLYTYKSNQLNPYDENSELGKEFHSHFILMPDAPLTFVIEKPFLYTVNLDENEWDIAPLEEGGIEAQNDAGVTLSLGVTANPEHALKTLSDVKNTISRFDKTAKLLAEPEKIGGYDAICYESNTRNGMEYACVAYIQTGKGDFALLVVGGKKNQADQVKATFKAACEKFQKKQD